MQETIHLDRVQQITGMNKGQIYEAIRDEGFPRPRTQGMRRGGWLEPLVLAWLKSKGRC